MKNRNPIAVALLPFVTFGIYGLYWQVKTKGEMNALGATIPTAWLIIVPIVNLWWLWKYCEGVEKVTAGKLNGVLAFILVFLIGSIGCAIIQDSFNNNVSAAATTVDNGLPTEAASAETTTPAETAPADSTPPADQTPTNPVS